MAGFLVVIVASCLCGCATAYQHRDVRFVKCLGMDRCRAPEKVLAAWSAQHEALYWTAVESLAREDACTGDLSTEGTAFQSERRLTLSCEKARAAIPWLEKNERIERAFAGKWIDHVTVFKKEHGLRTSKGIGVQLTASYYVKSDRSADPIAEGIDYYEVVEMGNVIEIQWVLKVAF
ncbi:MAG: hypothetical protein ABSB49_20185 [Polyangia bacterium]